MSPFCLACSELLSTLRPESPLLFQGLVLQLLLNRLGTTVIEIRETEVYARWFNRLRDREARARILVRIRRLSLGNPGKVEPIGEGVSEMKIDYGPGYRIYYKQLGKTLVILLVGGDKRRQKRDIEKAKKLARDL